MATHGAARGIATRERHASAAGVLGIRVAAVRAEWLARRERPWLGLVAVPLAMIATGLTGFWCTWPVLLAVSWVCTPSWHWSWILTLEEAFVGVCWTLVGAAALAASPDAHLLVGALWTGFPLALAGAGLLNRRRHARPEAYFPLR
jgi:hypothetical protein